MIGKTLNNRYSIIERIGGGGMANVYKAHDNMLDRDVAIKILKPEFVHDEDFIENFRRESHSAAKLNHPNIVGIFDVGYYEDSDGVSYYIVMEIVNGKTLKDLLKEKGRLSIDETIDYTIQIARGLLSAHQNGIIHRDIKPQNIILNGENIPKITDFGIAQGINKGITEKDIMGSVHYFSPEQAKGEKSDERSDIYSLGIMMFEMVTGELPFDGENPISVALKQANEQIRIPSNLNHEIPRELDEIIMKSTRKDPEERYSNLNEVISALETCKKNVANDFSDTMIIPNAERIKTISSDEQRRNRRTGIESTSRNKEYYETPKQEKKGGILPIIGGVLLALALATGIFMIFIKNFSGGGGDSSIVKDIDVPDLVGLQEFQAKNIVEDLGLVFEVSERTLDNNFNPGDVIRQNIDAGTKVEKGKIIRVTINSESAGTAEVLSYVDKDISEALAMINEVGLNAEVTYVSTNVKENVNKVLGQDLREGQRVEFGTTVHLTVGQEKQVVLTKVPDLLGLDEDKATKVLEESNLRLGKITERESNDGAVGTIISQSVAADVEVAEDTRVDIVIAKEMTKSPEEEPSRETEDKDDKKEDKKDKKEDKNSEKENKNSEKENNSDTKKPEQPSAPSNDAPSKKLVNYNMKFDLPTDRESVNIKIDKVENRTTTEVYNKQHSSSEGSIKVPIQASEDATFLIYVDGSLYQQYP